MHTLSLEFPANCCRVQFNFGLSSFLDLSQSLRPKLDQRIFLDPVFVASWILDQTWVL